MAEIEDLNGLISVVENDVFNDYLQRISTYHPITIHDYDEEEWKENHQRTLRVSKFVRTPDDLDLDNLCQLFQSFNDDRCTISLIYHHTSRGIEAYFRVADVKEAVSSPGGVNALVDRAKRVFNSVFPGADVNEVSSETDVLEKTRHIVSVTSLASEKNDSFVSIENLFNYQDNQEYTLLLIAEPVSEQNKLQEETNRLCNYLSDISNYESEQVTSNRTTTDNRNAQVSFIIASAGSGSAVSDSVSKTRTFSNYSVKHMQEKISKSLERIESCKAVGGWKFASYVLSDSLVSARNVAYQYAAIVRGKDSNGSASIVVPWEDDEECSIFKYLEANRHPVFKNEAGDIRDLTVLMSSLDLAHAMNFPRKAVPGFPVTECAAFGRNVSRLDDGEECVSEDNSIRIGDIWHMRHNDGSVASFDSNMLSSHVFITGSTGSGKSNTVYGLLDMLSNKGKTFLVIEPSKGEYRTIFGGRDDVTVYGTNYKHTKLLRINPFSFPEGIQLYSHLDRLIEIFNACWPMYAAMPAVLKEAIERAYIEAGWNLQTSENNEHDRLYPSFNDVLKQIDIVMNESDYSSDSKGDYKGALKTRLKSLTNGVFSILFGNDELSDEELFDENVIVDLSEIGSETTSLVMGLLILKLHEYRQSTRLNDQTTDSSLGHITVLEEAHNLLRRTSIEQTSDSSNLTGKSVEMITNAIAEMRTYGECFMIVDQAPGALDPAAIRNTNTKIILRLPDHSDRELVGKSIGLNDYQIIELGKLERGVAAVYQSGWVESVLCKFPKYEKMCMMTDAEQEMKWDTPARIILNAILYGSQLNEVSSVIKRMKDILIYKTTLPISVKLLISSMCETSEPITQEQLAQLAYAFFDADVLYKGDKGPSEIDMSKQYKKTLINFQIHDSFASRENINTVFTLIKQEHNNRENGLVDEFHTGGVR